MGHRAGHSVLPIGQAILSMGKRTRADGADEGGVLMLGMVVIGGADDHVEGVKRTRRTRRIVWCEARAHRTVAVNEEELYSRFPGASRGHFLHHQRRRRGG
jgi:hypothetical protein